MAASRPPRQAFQLVPDATLHITARGTDTIHVADRSLILQRYSVAGLIWGRETLWLDARGDLIAVATVDAEFDPVQAVKEGFESATGTFVRLAATDAIAALSGSSAQPRSTDTLIALVGGTLIDGTGAPPVPDAAVVISGTKIVAVGRRAERPDSARGTRSINATGATIMPGLWEMHAHYAQVEWGPIYLASGVTTARDVGNQFDFLLGAREVLNSGKGIGPRLLSAGIIDGDGPTGIGLARAGTPAQGVAWVRRYHDAGLRADQDLQQHRRLGAPGHHRRGPRARHDGDRPCAPQHGRLPGRRGRHGPDQPHHLHLPDDARPGRLHPPHHGLARGAEGHRLPRSSTTSWSTPRLRCIELNAHPADEPVSAFEPGVDKVAPELRQALTHTGAEPAEAAKAQAQFRTLLEIIGALHRAGVPIVAGTDLTVPGYSLHREMELYVQAGFTPMEAIQAATLVPARAMGLEKESGTLQPGMRADVLVVNGNPLERISDTRNVRFVIADGRYFEPAPLWRSVGFTP